MPITSDRALRPAKAYHHGDLREALIAATLRHVETTGHDTVSVASLSKELGVSQTASYRHFAGKNALLAAVAARSFALFGQVLRNAVADLSLERHLSANATAYVAFARERPGLYQLMFGSRLLVEAASDSELSIAARAAFDLLLDALRSTRPTADAVREAAVIWSGLHGLVQLDRYHLLSGPRMGDVPLHVLIEDIASPRQGQ